jgi:hypothetical protein
MRKPRARLPWPGHGSATASGLRRAGRRVDARDQLRAALQTFERIAAEPWAERARGELIRLFATEPALAAAT